jgi:Tol biopolymer transport system component
MKQLNEYSVRWLLVCLITVIVLGDGRAKADFICESSTKMPNVNGPNDDVMPSLTADGLSLYISSIRPGGLGGVHDLWVATRSSIQEDFGTPVNVGAPVSSPYYEDSPFISADGTELYFTDGYYKVGSHPYLRPGGFGVGDIWVSTRVTTDDEWGTPTNLGANVNSASCDGAPCLSADGLTLFFDSMRSGGSGGLDLWMATRPTISDAWEPAVNLGPNVNSKQDDAGARILPNGLTLVFTSNREGNYDLWATRRATISEPWGPPFKLGPEINTDLFEVGPAFSPDGSTVYLCRGEGGEWDLWQDKIIPIVDFNADGIVDKADICIMVDHWGEDYSLCDIGPMPFGDRIVDVQDLIVLAEHLLPVFLAHWELNETEGSIAYDSVGDHDGTLNGNPLWQPYGGKVNGALQFDGIDDYVSANFTWNIWKMKISATAWIKGGAPGQVIISQTDGTGYGASWLYADSSSGKLSTKLMDPQPALVSESVITDGAWHHIGLVWDGSYRYLYVDGAEVARDAAALSYNVPCDGSLYLGAGKTLDAGTFFSGMIDDVRIYNVALTLEQINSLSQ